MREAEQLQQEASLLKLVYNMFIMDNQIVNESIKKDNQFENNQAIHESELISYPSISFMVLLQTTTIKFLKC